MNIFGVRIDNLLKNEILNKVSVFLSEKKFHQVATINPEFILNAQHDFEFKNILDNCDLNVADGIGTRFAFWRFKEKLKSRITGADLMDEIFKIAQDNNQKIFLAANSRGLSTWEETSAAVRNKYPILNISGDNLDRNISHYKLPAASYDVVFCNFGSPQQEKFLNSLKSDNIRLAMGVGGGFDYLTGKVRRSPIILRKLGLEWLWRLIQQPQRIRRIWNAVIIFPIKVIFNK